MARINEKRGRRAKPQSLKLFAELSVVLTGGAVSMRTAERHLATIQSALGVGTLRAVLNRFSTLKGAAASVDTVGREMVADTSLGPTVKAIILLWLTGAISQQGAAPKDTSQEDYFEALMWTAVGAHPPALSDGYFGHWHYPPDEGS